MKCRLELHDHQQGETDDLPPPSLASSPPSPLFFPLLLRFSSSFPFHLLDLPLLLNYSSNEVPPLNVLIWISVKPLIRLIIPTGLGFILSRKGLFPAAASRGASQAILNCFLPCLLWSKIVPSITEENAPSIGPIFLVGFVYLGLSLLLGVFIRLLFPTPRNFRWGILAACTWSNWGDLPTSVVQTICASAPFSGTADSDLAIAYVAIFILVFYITLFPMRGIHLIERDYTHPPKPLEDLEGGDPHASQSSALLRKIGGMVRRRKGGEATGEPEAEDGKVPGAGLRKISSTASRRDPVPSFSPIHRTTTSRSIDSASVREIAGAAYAAAPSETPEHLSEASAVAPSGGQHHRRGSFGRMQLRQAMAERDRLKTIVGSPNGSVVDDDGDITEVGTDRTGGMDGSLRKGEGLTAVLTGSTPIKEQESADGKGASKTDAQTEPEEEQEKSRAKKVLLSVKGFVLSLATPPTIALVTALVIALVDRLKALFVVVDGYDWQPTAPEGDPPLAILLDTATFIGNGSVPLGLLVLGSALARMRIPRPFSRLPISSIIAVAVAKLVLLPVFGYFFVTALANHTTLIDKEDRVLQFTAIYFSVVPTATTQVALTQIFAPENGEGSNSDVLASYLIFQYVVFLFSGVILTAVTLSNIF
ncbi:hypothetical protein JCM6882_005765 [Rhodosporidiobolus microsporus]